MHLQFHFIGNKARQIFWKKEHFLLCVALLFFIKISKKQVKFIFCWKIVYYKNLSELWVLSPLSDTTLVTN